MLLNLINGWAAQGITGEHFGEKILDLLGEAKLFAILPEFRKLFVRYQLICLVLLARIAEWEAACQHVVNHHSEREDIRLSTIEDLLLPYLGSHIRLRASEEVKLLDLLVLCEPKVRNLKVELVIIQDVLRLDVEMDSAIFVNV